MFLIHQVRANGNASDALFRQQQALQRTLPPANSVLADALKLWWTWRGWAERPFFRSMVLIIGALLLTIATIVASILSSQRISLISSRVRIVAGIPSSRCTSTSISFQEKWLPRRTLGSFIPCHYRTHNCQRPSTYSKLPGISMIRWVRKSLTESNSTLGCLLTSVNLSGSACSVRIRSTFEKRPSIQFLPTGGHWSSKFHIVFMMTGHLPGRTLRINQCHGCTSLEPGYLEVTKTLRWDETLELQPNGKTTL